MSGPRITDAAVEAGGDALYDDLFEFGLSGTDTSNAAEKCITSALPHIERAVIQRLIEKLTNTEPGPNWLGYKAWACDWLRAELEGDDRG